MTSYKGYGIDYNLYGHGEYSVQYAGDDVIFPTIEKAREFIDDVTGAEDTMFLLAYDVTMLFIDLDPYGAADEKDYGESDEDQAARIAGTIGPEDIANELDDFEEMCADEPRNLEIISAFRERLKKLA